jgi:Uma2 family endonuclease
MVDPEEKTVEAYALRKSDYVLLGRYNSSQTANSEILPGFKVRVDELFLP